MSDELIEGEDYYLEGPYMVFTEAYLRRRGYCCESGCRHCPWGYRRDQRAEASVESGGVDDDDDDDDKSAS